MSEQYLFRRADGAMIFGDNANSIYQGPLWIRPTTGNMVELRNLDGSIFKKEFDVTEIYKNADDDFYADIADFNAVSGTFFFRVGASTSKWKKFSVVGADGVETGQDPLVISGTTDFTLPSDCDVAKDMIVLNPWEVPFSLVVIEGVNKIRFAQAPRVGDAPSIYYQTK